MAAGGHYGNKASNLVKHYVKDLGFDYPLEDVRTATPEDIKRVKEILNLRESIY